MYHIVPLTNDEVAHGALFRVQDALTGASDASMKRVREGARNLEAQDILVYYSNAQDNPGFNEEWGTDVMEVLYANDIAYQLLLSQGIVTSELTTEELPDKVINPLRVPYYS